MSKLIVEYYLDVIPVGISSGQRGSLKITWICFQEILNYGLAKLRRGHWKHTTQHGGKSISTTLDSWAHVVYGTCTVNCNRPVDLKVRLYFKADVRHVWNIGVNLPNTACIYSTGMAVTCVSLKSFTPTQYTIAPRDLALSACREKEGKHLLLPENWHSSNGMRAFLLLSLEMQPFRKSGLSVKLLPLAAQWWAGVPAALHLSVQ